MESHSNSCSTKLFIMQTGAFSPSKQPQASNGCWKVITPQLEHSAQVRVSQLLRGVTEVECHCGSFAHCYGILGQPLVKMSLERFGTLCQETRPHATRFSECRCRAWRQPHLRTWSVAYECALWLWAPIEKSVIARWQPKTPADSANAQPIESSVAMWNCLNDWIVSSQVERDPWRRHMQLVGKNPCVCATTPQWGAMNLNGM